MPERIQRKRERGWRKGDAVIVDRTSKYGNPWSVKQGYSLDECYIRFEVYLIVRRTPPPGWADPVGYPSDDQIRRDLAGKDLACPCELPEQGRPDRCHAVLLRQIANEVPDA